MMKKLLVVVAVVSVVSLISLVGCVRHDDVVREDQGRLCAVASDPVSFEPTPPQSFSAGAPVIFNVTVAQCLSSSCDTDRAVSCSVTRNGQNLVVTSDGSWTSQTGGSCTADCGILATTCTTDALEPGTYAVQFGGQAMTLSVPATVPSAPCVTAGGD
jgi:hypothetical protein